MNANKSWQPTLIGVCLALAALAASSSRTIQEKGRDMATGKLDFPTGISNALQATGTEAGESVIGGAGHVVRGVERGPMRSRRGIVVDPTLANAGLDVTTVNDLVADRGGVPLGLSAYVVSSASAKGVLHAQMFDAMNNEIGRTSVRIDRAADEAKYEALLLDPLVKRSDIRKIAFVFKPGAAG